MSIFGCTVDDEELYRLVLRTTGSSLEQLATLRGVDVDGLRRQLARLTDLGLVSVAGGKVSAGQPDQAIGRLVSEETQRLIGVGEQLAALRAMVPSLATEYHAAHAPRGEPVAVEAVADADVVGLIRNVSATSTGELLWLRPDHWRVPAGRDLDEWVRGLVAAGRRSRAIYPARVLAEAPEVVRAGAEAGEHVRILASVPAHLAVMGDSAALVPELWWSNNGRRLVVRQPGLVRSLQLLFTQLWDRAMPVPGLGGPRDDDGRAERRMVLDQLAAGAKDEQIARTLGLSLRTVRRRVAAILDDLAVDSRFQAGAEAVRRGWL